ncbi:DeoR/GlpR transcriptional regulator [Atopobacter sp. AH10]|uniref:DeoR/GlpR family DNA-binding transcription regulator n=1 Tax=Atopobacter sp. AH10 TaxID=2315861 RepID=UPI000EF251E7|nr:DeoR/GlpR family DNA-binding transcription regulator [Atopobacter sp. AH10]RLK63459.1 DeoR/GlpR transcriptional regulator [Atopobacter sp. AH10]
MLKNERWKIIQEMLSQKDIVTVSDIVERLDVSDMTVRRDLNELEKNGILKRVHGGAVGNDRYPHQELSHKDKQIMHMAEKEKVAEQAVTLVEDNDIIFMGPGTTLEAMATKLKNPNIVVVTNCLPVFQKLIANEVKTYLLGGEIRLKTEAFNGEITMNSLKNMHFHKAFFSCNGIVDNKVMTATLAEGITQELALENATERYLLIDSSKIGQKDFYEFYNLADVTSVICDKDPKEKYQKLMAYVDVMCQ